MAFDAYDVSISLLRSLVPLFARLAAVDPKLEDQARRAATSVALNLQEASRRTGRDRRNRFRISLGSAAEVGAALDVAVAYGYIDELDAADARSLLDLVRAMTYRSPGRRGSPGLKHRKPAGSRRATSDRDVLPRGNRRGCHSESGGA